jgi:hypothetical protein
VPESFHFQTFPLVWQLHAGDVLAYTSACRMVTLD